MESQQQTTPLSFHIDSLLPYLNDILEKYGDNESMEDDNSHVFSTLSSIKKKFPEVTPLVVNLEDKLKQIIEKKESRNEDNVITPIMIEFVQELKQLEEEKKQYLLQETIKFLRQRIFDKELGIDFFDYVQDIMYEYIQELYSGYHFLMKKYINSINKTFKDLYEKDRKFFELILELVENYPTDKEDKISSFIKLANKLLEVAVFDDCKEMEEAIIDIDKYSIERIYVDKYGLQVNEQEQEEMIRRFEEFKQKQKEVITFKEYVDFLKSNESFDGFKEQINDIIESLTTSTRQNLLRKFSSELQNYPFIHQDILTQAVMSRLDSYKFN